MKKCILLALATLVLFSCGLFEGDHTLRIKNDFATALDINVGPVAYGTIAAGTTSDYKSVGEGDHAITGAVTGSISISGKGIHKWTLTVVPAGTVSVKED